VPPDRQTPIRLEEPPPPTVAVLGASAIVIGLVLLSTGPFRFTPGGALAGVVGQLPTTLPAALLVLTAFVLNAAAGTVIMRLALGRPFWTLAEAALGGVVGAVLLDLVLLAALGGSGTFRWPALAAVHAIVLVAGRRIDSWLVQDPARAWPPAWLSATGWRAGRRPRPSLASLPTWWPLWAVIGLAWSGVLLVQLASPVVPFVDVLPNHVAPVEHLRTFGSFELLTTTASPIYGPSRTFLGYIALVGVVDTLTTLPAVLAVAAFAVPGAIAVAIGLHRLGGALGGGQSGTWAVLTFVLTTSFVRLPDARATVLVLPLAAWCLAEVADRLAGRQPPTLRGALVLAGALAATILVHPVIGSLTVLSVGLVTLGWPDRARPLCVPALLGAGILALPQLAAMTETALPTIAALIVIPLAVPVVWLTWQLEGVQRALIGLGRLACLPLALLGLLGAGAVLDAAGQGIGRLLPTIPILVVTCLAGLLLAARRMLHPVLLGGLAAGLIAATATNLVPEGGTLMTALRFEVPKTLHYWVPVVFALGAAMALDSLWRDDRLPVIVPRLALAAFLLAAILPLRDEPLTDAYHLGERRVTETLSLQLQTAELGYWRGYPDSRRLVAGDQLGLLDAVRAEIAAGRLDSRDGVLHVARSFQQWVAVPLGVFAGVIETDVTPDAEASIHTVGGRLRPFGELAERLAAGYPYVMLEPAGLPPETWASIAAAGYRSIYANPRGELFVRGEAGGS